MSHVSMEARSVHFFSFFLPFFLLIFIISNAFWLCENEKAKSQNDRHKIFLDFYLMLTIISQLCLDGLAHYRLSLIELILYMATCKYILCMKFKILFQQCRIYHCAYVCLSTGPRWPEGASSCQILNLKVFCFGTIPDIMI